MSKVLTTTNLRCVTALTLMLTTTSCDTSSDPELAEALLVSPRYFEYFDCKGRLSYSDDALRAAASRGEEGSLSLFVELEKGSKPEARGVGFYALSDTTRMTYEYYETKLIDGVELQFGQSAGSSNDDVVEGRFLKGTGYLEIAWKYAGIKSKYFIWRGKCSYVKEPPLADVIQRSDLN